MREFLLYCAGPITGVSYGESIDWREYVARNLPPHIQAVSPMRGKKYLAEEENIKDSYEKYPLSCQKGITCRDRMDVMRCDMVLANFFGANKVSVGTVMEIAWADAWRKPIVVVMEEDNIHSHAMIREVSGFIVHDLDEAIMVATAVLSPTSSEVSIEDILQAWDQYTAQMTPEQYFKELEKAKKRYQLRYPNNIPPVPPFKP